MDTIAIVDTSICTDNLGDEIIMDAVNSVVAELFPDAYAFRVPSHEALSDRTRKFIRQANWCFIGGTNLLSSNITPHGLWRLDQAGANAYGSTRTVCLGTGWNDYMAAATPLARNLLQTSLFRDVTHSARDSYTQKHLEQIGRTAISTSCPTTWNLTPEHCSTLPTTRSNAVIFTLSAWRPDVEADRAFVETLRRHYKTVWFFPQMQDDYAYFQKFGWTDIKVVAATTQAYTHFLENEDVDFVGTRLHGGIRALQKGRRALILAIDNRAAEINRDTGLPVLQRNNQAGIAAWLEREEPIMLNLPQGAIQRWKDQFRGPQISAFTKPLVLPEIETTSRMSALKSVVKTAIGRA